MTRPVSDSEPGEGFDDFSRTLRAVENSPEKGNRDDILYDLYKANEEGFKRFTLLSTTPR